MQHRASIRRYVSSNPRYRASNCITILLCIQYLLLNNPIHYVIIAETFLGRWLMGHSTLCLRERDLKRLQRLSRAWGDHFSLRFRTRASLSYFLSRSFRLSLDQRGRVSRHRTAGLINSLIIGPRTL